MPGLDMWWKSDLRNVLRGIALATPYMGVERTSAEAAAFREGFMAALSSVALTLGIAEDAPRLRARMIEQGHFLEGR